MSKTDTLIIEVGSFANRLSPRQAALVRELEAGRVGGTVEEMEELHNGVVRSLKARGFITTETQRGVPRVVLTAEGMQAWEVYMRGAAPRRKERGSLSEFVAAMMQVRKERIKRNGGKGK